MKKKILSICLVAVIAVMAIAGASLAYFTDTDEATNVFTIGNVDITLNEQQRNDDGTALEDFEQNKTLMPVVESAQGAKDKFGLTTANNYVDKVVTVTNNGESDAYVRVFVAIPAALEAGSASQNVLHWNTGNKFTADGNYDTTANPQPANPDYNTECVYAEVGKTEIDGVEYNVYSFSYQTALKKDETTKYASFVGFYLDKNVDCKYVDGELVYTINGTEIDYDFTNGVTIPVFAQAIQAAGFDNAKQAFAELPANPWAE